MKVWAFIAKIATYIFLLDVHLSILYPCSFLYLFCYRVFNDNGNVTRTTQFNPVGKYSQSTREGSFDMRGNRVTKLGTNM